MAIYAKALRENFDHALEQSDTRMASSLTTSTKLILGQEEVQDRSNEITVIHKLMDLLKIEGAIISIDTIGVQKKLKKKVGVQR